MLCIICNEGHYIYNNHVCVQIGAKYKQVARGLQVSNISRKDNGNYTCSAEVGSEGRYEEKRITVVVHGKEGFIFKINFFTQKHFNCC